MSNKKEFTFTKRFILKYDEPMSNLDILTKAWEDDLTDWIMSNDYKNSTFIHYSDLTKAERKWIKEFFNCAENSIVSFKNPKVLSSNLDKVVFDDKADFIITFLYPVIIKKMKK